MKYSIVTSLYQTGAYLAEFHRRCSEAVHRLGSEYEIVLVNDDSPDNSLAASQALAATDPHVCVIDLGRNVGQHEALQAGLRAALGDRIFVLDSDLEEDPLLLVRFADLMNASHADVIVGQYAASYERGFLYRCCAQLYFLIMRLLLPRYLPRKMTACLLSRRTLDAMNAIHAPGLTLADLYVLTARHIIAVPCEKTYKGSSSYTWRSRLKLGFGSIVAIALYRIGVRRGSAET